MKAARSVSSFFVLRTPLLPFGDLAGLSADLESPARDPRDRAVVRARLRALITRPEIAEALAWASPSLTERVKGWLAEERAERTTPRGDAIELALVRYLARMCSRPPPLGLLAGWSVGRTGPETSLELEACATYARHTTPSHATLAALASNDTPSTALLTPNDTLHRRGDRFLCIVVDDGGMPRLIEAPATPHLARLVERARSGGAVARELADALLELDPDLESDEALAFVDEVEAAGLLVSGARAALTGRDLLAVAPAARGFASAVAAELRRLDQEPLGAAIDRYSGIARALGADAAPSVLSVDLEKKTRRCSLAPAVTSELARGAAMLNRWIGALEPDALEHFRGAFAHRYGLREVPLLEVLDEEHGIGLPQRPGTASSPAPLLAGIDLGEPAPPRAAPFREVHAVLLRKITEAARAGARAIELDDAELRADLLPERPLPDAFAVVGTLLGRAREPGEDAQDAAVAESFRVVVRGVSGPSGARLLGRLCHADPSLEEQVRAHLRAEEALEPDAVFAEVVHLPADTRLGDVLARPVLRGYEIPCLGSSGAPASGRIELDDLRVSIRRGRVVLRSVRLDREVLPRLSAAHDYGHPGNLALYRFLGALQDQGVAAALAWSWGPLESLPFLPRVISGRVVLAPARWRIERRELEELATATGAERVRRTEALRAARALPRWVSHREGENDLAIDLGNVLAVDAFLHDVKARSSAILTELLPGPDELCVEGPEGAFVHDLVVPFVSAREPTRRVRAPRAPSGGAALFVPGSEWTYVKLYTSPSDLDRILVSAIRPLMARLSADAHAIDRWHFLRYGDPEWHLRLRIRTRSEEGRAATVHAIEAMAAGLTSARLVHRVSFETYEPENERYGGPVGLELAERMFAIDSDAVAASLAVLAEGRRLGDAWRVALAGTHLLLADLGLDATGASALVSGIREQLGAELAAGDAFVRTTSERFRRDRASLVELVESEIDDPLLAGAVAPLRRRSELLRPLAAELHEQMSRGAIASSLPELAASLVHMHANRVLRSAHRAQELVLCELLRRLYRSQAGRARRVDMMATALPSGSKREPGIVANRAF